MNKRLPTMTLTEKEKHYQIGPCIRTVPTPPEMPWIPFSQIPKKEGVFEVFCLWNPSRPIRYSLYTKSGWHLVDLDQKCASIETDLSADIPSGNCKGYRAVPEANRIITSPIIYGEV